jgi:hypothetical protein
MLLSVSTSVTGCVSTHAAGKEHFPAYSSWYFPGGEGTVMRIRTKQSLTNGIMSTLRMPRKAIAEGEVSMLAGKSQSNCREKG